MRRYDKIAVNKMISGKAPSATAIVHSVDMDRVNITIGNVSTLIRGVEVAGDAKKIAPGSVVPITWRAGRPVVLQTTGEIAVPSAASQNAAGQSVGYPQTIFYDVIAGNVVGTTPAHFSDSNVWTGGAWYILQVVGDYAEYTFGLQAGAYNLTIMIAKRSSYGIFQIYFDGALLGEQDTYSSTATYNVMLSLPLTVMNSGIHTLHLELTGKNSSSSGYRIVSNWVTICPTNS